MKRVSNDWSFTPEDLKLIASDAFAEKEERIKKKKKQQETEQAEHAHGPPITYAHAWPRALSPCCSLTAGAGAPADPNLKYSTEMPPGIASR